MNFIGIDYGEKRIGISVSHDIGLALPFDVLENNYDSINQIIDLCEEEEIDKIIVGMPYGMKGNTTEQTKQVKNFIIDLKEKTELPIEEMDERLSSVEAAKDLPKEINDRLKDAREATIILQSYLDKNYGLQD